MIDLQNCNEVSPLPLQNRDNTTSDSYSCSGFSERPTFQKYTFIPWHRNGKNPSTTAVASLAWMLPSPFYHFQKLGNRWYFLPSHSNQTKKIIFGEAFLHLFFFSSLSQHCKKWVLTSSWWNDGNVLALTDLSRQAMTSPKCSLLKQRKVGFHFLFWGSIRARNNSVLPDDSALSDNFKYYNILASEGW